jgi:hypothetical protein
MNVLFVLQPIRQGANVVGHKLILVLLACVSLQAYMVLQVFQSTTLPASTFLQVLPYRYVLK